MSQANRKSQSHVYLFSDVNVAQASSDGDSPRQFSGIANSGKPFNYYGTRIIVDLKDIQFHFTATWAAYPLHVPCETYRVCP